MDLYEYVGRNSRGESMRGTMESPNAQAVATWLSGSDIFPVSIRRVNEDKPPLPPFLAKLLNQDKITDLDMLLFTRQMSNMVKAGLQVLESIEGIQRSTSSLPLKAVLGAVRGDLDRGANLSAAFSRHPKVFSEYYVNMIRVGEGTGQLLQAFQSLQHQMEFDRQMKQKIKAATRYPMFVFIALGIALAIMTLFVIPSFARTYSSLKVDLPVMTQMLLGVSAFAVNFWWLVLLLFGLCYYIVMLILRTPDGRYNWDKWKLRVPVIGIVMMKATVARFARSFATAVRADVPMVMAFQLVSKVVDNAYFEDRIYQMQKGVERGEVLSRVMRTSGVFSPLELQLIGVGEKTGDVGKAVEEIAELYSEEVEYEVGKLSQTLEPILLVIMGVLVAVLLLGIFLPMWQLSQAYLHHK